jgi:hypothetical protein
MTNVPDEIFFGIKPKLSNHLKEWGHVGHVTNRKAIQKKLINKAIKVILLWYPAQTTPRTPT